MNILDNKLVKKYFCPDGVGEADPYVVLRAMQETIRKGDKYLDVEPNLDIREKIADNRYEVDIFHAFALRLPDKFQNQLGEDIEDYVKAILKRTNCPESALRELLRLARKSK